MALTRADRPLRCTTLAVMRRLLPVRWLRALIWALALALPVQAMAAVAMLSCGPAGHGHPPQEQQHQHQHHSSMAEAHHDESESAEPQHHAQHQCSACAACCVGAALPSATTTAPQTPQGHGVHRAQPQAASLGVVIAGPERPPRPLLA